MNAVASVCDSAIAAGVIGPAQIFLFARPPNFGNPSPLYLRSEPPAGEPAICCGHLFGVAPVRQGILYVTIVKELFCNSALQLTSEDGSSWALYIHGRAANRCAWVRGQYTDCTTPLAVAMVALIQVASVGVGAKE